MRNRMIYELKENEYERVLPLFKELDHYLAINAVVDGICPGQIYVDDVINPKCAILIGPHDNEGEGHFYLSGNEDVEFAVSIRDLVAEELYPEAIKSGYSHFIIAHSPKWEKKLTTVILKDKYPMRAQELYYSLSQSKFSQDWRRSIPKGFFIKRIDNEIIKRSTNSKLHLRHLHTWKSLETFLEKGFGYVSLNHENTIVAWCVTKFLIGKRCELAIETDENYRRRGLATCVASATVEYALCNNIASIVWHCWEDNVASQKTAEKVGFEKSRVSTVHFAFYDEEFNLKFKKDWDKEHNR